MLRTGRKPSFEKTENSFLAGFSTVRLAATAVICLLVSGCGTNLAQVSGVVTVDGQPLRGGDDVHATVYFQPASRDGASAAGRLDENGVYHLSCGSQEGISPGEYVVTFSASQMIRGKDADDAPTGKRISDPKYASAKTSGIRFVVQAGSNECDISLKSSVESGQKRSGVR